MPTRTIYLRGRVSAPAIIEQLAGEAAFLKDAQGVLELDAEAFEKLVAALATCDSFLTDEQLKSSIEGSVGNAELAAQLFLLTRNLDRTLRGLDEPIEETLRMLRASIKEDGEDIPVEDRGEIGERLEKLILSSPGLGLRWKARQLAESTGIELEDIQIICDIRPVFDEARSKILGAVAVSTLKLAVFARDGTPENIEVRLTDGQLADLASKADLAGKKIKVIKKTLDDKSIPWAVARDKESQRETT